MKFSPLWTRTLFTAVSFYEIQKIKIKNRNNKEAESWENRIGYALEKERLRFY